LNLLDILKDVEYEIKGNKDIDIEYLSIDSRNIKKNTMFICITGFNVDGHDFIDTALEKGAVCLVVEKEIKSKYENLTIIKVKNSRISMSTIANNFYKNPTENIKMIGVTGTNGKTSVSFYIHSILMKYKLKVGLIGTVSTKINKKDVPIEFATSTTPDTIELMQILDYMKQNNVDNIVMEVTSHALALYKVEDLKFFVSVFTNLTQDHLDLHKTMENYRNAKAKLFTKSNISVINIDDEYGKYMEEIAIGKVITYSIEKDSDIKAENIIYSQNYSSFDVYIFGKNHKFILPIPGIFSVYNALATIGVAISLDIPITVIQDALENLETVPGRIETIPNTMGLNIIVDYSHTPDSLKNIILTAKEFTKNKVITVFGCGGDRDKSKRPLMAKESSTFSDFSVITSDNPRTEEPTLILKDIEKGMVNKNYILIEDRKEAIEFAINMATKYDTVIIAGKGHETYQIFKDKTIDFDDRLVVKEAINKKI